MCLSPFRPMLQVLINFTMGLVGALVAFLWQIWALIKSYQVFHALSVA
jgi:hypothetical protein